MGTAQDWTNKKREEELKGLSFSDLVINFYIPL